MKNHESEFPLPDTVEVTQDANLPEQVAPTEYATVSQVERTAGKERDGVEMGVVRQRLDSLDDVTSSMPQSTDSTSETVIRKGRSYTVRYAPREELGPMFGYASGNQALVRDDLPPRVQNFVKEHELYHCRDTANWGGWIGAELRANIVPGLKDPIGLAATIRASLTPERLRFYLQRFREGR